MKNMLDRISENDENIKTYFPENPKFKEEEKKDNKYGTKESSTMYSIPPKTNFG